MIELRKILFPTDFSDASTHALQYALGMAQRFGAGLTVLHVIDEQLFSEGLNLPRVTALADLEKEMTREAERRMAALLEGTADSGVAIATVIAEGRPFVEIIRYARENAVDLIVIGTHGRSGFEHVIFGSTAERVVRKAPCPVLSIKPRELEFTMP